MHRIIINGTNGNFNGLQFSFGDSDSDEDNDYEVCLNS